MPGAELALRVLAGCAAALLLYIVAFLYEDEDRLIHSRLDDWWIRIDDLQRLALTKQTAFLRETSRLTTAVFDRLYGERLFSVRACVVSFGLLFMLGITIAVIANLVLYGYIAPLWLLVAFVANGLIAGMGLAIVRSPNIANWIAAGIGGSFLVFCAIQGISRRGVALTGPKFTEPGSPLYLGPNTPVWAFYLVMCSVYIAAAVLVTLFAAIGRWAVRPRTFFSFASTIGRIIAAGALPIALPGWLLFTTLVESPTELKPHWPLANLVVMSLTGVSLLCTIPALVFVLLAALMLLHRFFWPSISRPLYAIARHNVLGQRKLLTTAAVILLALALAPIDSWTTILLKRLGLTS